MAENKWLTVLVTLVIGVINPVTGRGPTLYHTKEMGRNIYFQYDKMSFKWYGRDLSVLTYLYIYILHVYIDVCQK